MGEEEQLKTLIDQTKTDITNDRDTLFNNLEERLSKKINNLEQLVRGNTIIDEDIDPIQPYERDISMETRPQLNSAGLKEYNEHVTHLSNHELHQIKEIHQKDHRKKIRTILDEPLGLILDNTINFLSYSNESFHKKTYEAELMEDVRADDKSFYNQLKVYSIALVLFIRDERNITYLGIIMVILSIIIYFTNIITTAG